MEKRQVEYRGPLIKISGVGLSFGEKEILRDINEEVLDVVGRGQVICILGESGVGKSQLLRILAGLQKPTTGSVLITHDQIPIEVGKVGMVFQKYPLYPDRKVLGNLMVAGGSAGLSRKESREKALALLNDFGLSELVDMWTQQISGGQQQRVAIMQQLMCSEHFLLMDEPVSGLDVAATKRVCRRVTKIAEANEFNTVIIVTHDVPAAIQMADELWLMGHERNLDGSKKPGARVVKKYNLIEEGLAWHDNITKMPEYFDCIRKVWNDLEEL